MKRARVLHTAAVAILSLAVFGAPVNAVAGTAAEIDAAANDTLTAFYKMEKAGRELVASSKGVLVFPSVYKGALLVGFEGGEGALRVGGKTVDYYNTAAASLGIQLGGQSKSMIIMFRDAEALEKFQASNGWEAGVDGQVAFLKEGSGDTLTTLARNEPIVAYVFGNKGLLFDVSMKGAKFTKLDK